jgi:hypothetical protein
MLHCLFLLVAQWAALQVIKSMVGQTTVQQQFKEANQTKNPHRGGGVEPRPSIFPSMSQISLIPQRNDGWLILL